ncbi:MAG: cyclodeaminase/cyclohydrolase family protein, partial [Parabacteroides gordonii]|nr:cyclodeaminase/cyclohydrolase family protein [Parabacteroides gordonii]
TCVLGALLNVRINLGSSKDEAFVKRMQEKADFLEAEAIRIETKLLDWVKTIL